MSGFALKSGDSADFAARCNDIFASLDTLTPKPKTDAETNRDDPKPRSSLEPSKTSDYRGQESIFRLKDSDGFSVPRRPDLPRFQRGGRGGGLRPPSRVPGHLSNPRKYTKYSLEDVDELSDRGNARAAFDFLRQRAQIRETEDSSETSEAEPAKITFKRPLKKQESIKGEQESIPKFGGGSGGFGKRVLPECVVGAVPKFGHKKSELKRVRVVDDGDDDDDDEAEALTKRPEDDVEESSPKKKPKSSAKLSFQFEDDE